MFLLSLILSLVQPVYAEKVLLWQLNANGSPGFQGRNGTDYGYSRGFDGNNAYSPGQTGGNGQDGRSGGSGSPGTRGENGGHVTVRFAWHPTEANTLLIDAQIDAQKLPTQSLAFQDDGVLLISANGGNGGHGGNGGSAEAGGNGGKGGNADRWNPRSGDGGRGGNGGDAGAGADGGNGGNGGRVLVEVPKGDTRILDSLQIENFAGLAGRAGNNGRAGSAGRGGDPGEACYFDQNGSYQCTFRGSHGMRGMDGRPAYTYPRTGNNGLNGQTTFIEY